MEKKIANSDKQRNEQTIMIRGKKAIRSNKKTVIQSVLRNFCRKSKINVAQISRPKRKTTWISFKGEMIMQITYDVAGNGCGHV